MSALNIRKVSQINYKFSSYLIPIDSLYLHRFILNVSKSTLLTLNLS